MLQKWAKRDAARGAQPGTSDPGPLSSSLQPLSPHHFLFLSFFFLPRDKCFLKTFQGPPGMRQIKPSLSPSYPVLLSARRAPHTGPGSAPSVSLSGTPCLAEAIFMVGRLREMRLGVTRQDWAGPQRKPGLSATGSSDSGPLGGVWGFWEPRTSCGRRPEAEGKGVFFRFTKSSILYRHLCLSCEKYEETVFLNSGGTRE